MEEKTKKNLGDDQKKSKEKIAPACHRRKSHVTTDMGGEGGNSRGIISSYARRAASGDTWGGGVAVKRGEGDVRQKGTVVETKGKHLSTDRMISVPDLGHLSGEGRGSKDCQGRRCEERQAILHITTTSNLRRVSPASEDKN